VQRGEVAVAARANRDVLIVTSIPADLEDLLRQLETFRRVSPD